MKRKYKKIARENILQILDDRLVDSTDSDAQQEIILSLVPVDIHFGLKRSDGNNETPWRHFLSIYPSPEFASDMNRLDQIKKSKNVRILKFLRREKSSLPYSEWTECGREVGPSEKITGRKNASTRFGISHSSNFGY